MRTSLMPPSGFRQCRTLPAGTLEDWSTSHHELSELERLFVAPLEMGKAPHLAILGASGSGKSSLAAWYCREQKTATRFKDDIFWIDLTPGSSGEEDALPRSQTRTRVLELSSALGGSLPADSDLATATDDVLSRLANRNCLLVLDGAEDPDWLRAFLKGAPGSSCLVLTRAQQISGILESKFAMTEPDELERVNVLRETLTLNSPQQEAALLALARALPPSRRLLHLAAAELRQRMAEPAADATERFAITIDFLLRAFTPSQTVNAITRLSQFARQELETLADGLGEGRTADQAALLEFKQAELLDPTASKVREDVFNYVRAERSSRSPGRPPEPEQSPVGVAHNILRGTDASPERMLEIANQLKKQNEFGLARKLLARARQFESKIPSDRLRLKLRQQHALCTYKDPDQPLAPRLEFALEILNEGVSLETTRDQESLGIAGAIHKRMWQADGQRLHLERALGFYLRGYGQGVLSDQGYTAINAAYILDCLASLEIESARTARLKPESARVRQQQARDIRQEILRTLPCLLGSPGYDWLNDQWWFHVTLAEAAFGLGQYDEAVFWLMKARQIPVEPWEYESSARQLAGLARMSAAGCDTDEDASKRLDPAWLVIERFLGNATAAESNSVGKIGLALSGGGFRASLFHIGMLARLAELDLLRSVEVLSCVSGGSIVGAHYYLELRNLLEEKADAEITRGDYIELVRRMADDFLAGVQTNIRTRVLADWWTNFRMMFDSSYSRSHRVGELYEQNIFARIDRAKIKGQGEPRPLQTPILFHDGSDFALFIHPKGEGPGFKPKSDNWCRRAKVPVIILNATTLNTGHNWQFTATFMGESPAAIDASIDGNDRLRRMYHDAAPAPHNRLRFGYAVAASACVPGLFEPLPMENLYPGMTVRLVDGGVYDNQGIAGLLEQDANFLIVSDASGQMGVQKDPSAALLGVPLRANDILMARVRVAEAQDLRARRRSGLLRILMFMHLKKDLDVDPVDWCECPDPHAASDEARPASRRTLLTSYGLRKDMQEEIAALRTDLDSFSDVEAYALMTSGYRMAEREFTEQVKGLGRGDDKQANWKFLEIEQHLNLSKANDSAAMSVLNQLKVGSQLAFKVWRLSPGLQVLAYGIAILAAALMAWLLWNRRAETMINLKYGALGTFLLVTVGTIILGKTVMRIVTFSSELRRILLGVLMCIGGFLVARLHLWFFDPLFLSLGRLDKLEKYQPLSLPKDLRVWLSLIAGGLLWAWVAYGHRLIS